MQEYAVNTDKHNESKIEDHQIIDCALENEKRYTRRHHTDPAGPDELHDHTTDFDYLNETNTVSYPQQTVEICNQNRPKPQNQTTQMDKKQNKELCGFPNIILQELKSRRRVLHSRQINDDNT